MRVKTRSTMPRRADAGGNERAHLRHDYDQRGLAQISALAAHVGTGEHDDVMGFRIQKKIVGTKRSLAGGEFLLLDHGMTAVDNFEIAATASESRSNFGRQ